MDIAMDVSLVDWPMLFGLSERTWGIKGVHRIIDKIARAGIREIHWRAYAAGPQYPSRVPDAGVGFDGGCDEYASMVYGESHAVFANFSLATWDNLAEAVDYAHSRGMRFLAWNDQTDNHGGTYQSKWSKLHPQYWLRKKDGSHYYPDRHLSLAFPEVVEYRLALMREMVEDYGVDGIYLIFMEYIGYEDPVVETFEEKHGVNPRTLDPLDERWTVHRAEYITAYLRQVHELLTSLERKLCRKLDLVIEGQSTALPQHLKVDVETREQAWKRVNPLLDVETIAQERLIDGFSFWLPKEIETWAKHISDSVRVGTRFRVWDRPSKEKYLKHLKVAKDYGCTFFTINESTPIERDDDWSLVKEVVEAAQA